MIFLDYLDLLGYLTERGVQYDVIVNGTSIKTLDDILRLQLAPERVVKSLLLKSKYGTLVASIPMSGRLNIGKVRGILGTGVGFAGASEIPNYGYEVGAVPPMYHRDVSMYLFDKKLTNYPRVLSGSGYTDKLIELNVEDIVKLSRPKICDISD